MKQNQRIIKKGDYYELQTIQDIMLQQKAIKKQDIIMQPSTTTNNQNILIQLPARKDIMKNYHIGFNVGIGVGEEGDRELDGFQDALENILKLEIRDQERFEVEKLIHEINQIKNSEILPLNSLPPSPSPSPSSSNPPLTVPLLSPYCPQPLLSSLTTLQQIKSIQLSKLQTLTQILLGQNKEQVPLQLSQIDAKTKQQIELLYNNLNQLKCIRNLNQIIFKISSNQIKYLEVMKDVENVEDVFGKNKAVLEEFENDGVVLGELQSKFKENLVAVRAIVKKLNQ